MPARQYDPNQESLDLGDIDPTPVVHAVLEEPLNPYGSTACGTYTYLEGLAGSRELKAVCAMLLESGLPVCCDLETTGLSPILNEILLVAFTYDGQRSYVFHPRYVDITPFISVIARNPMFNQNCFQTQTPILLADGTSKYIGEIVNKKLDVEVMSYNPVTKKIEPNRVTGWFRNGRQPDWFEIRFEHKPVGCNLLVTGRHKFYVRDGDTVVKRDVASLEPGDSVLLNEPTFSEDQFQFILGSVLGDGAIQADKSSSTAYFSCSHSPKQQNYLAWKRDSLEEFCDSDPYTLLNSRGFSANHFGPFSLTTIRTRCLYQLSQIKNITHPNGKKSISAELLDLMDERAVAVWYMDDGCWTKYEARICAYSFSSEDIDRFISWMYSKFGIFCRRRDTVNGPLVIFSKQSRFDFIDLIQPYIHADLEYKANCRPSVGWNMQHAVDAITEVKIHSKVSVDKTTKKRLMGSGIGYDIEVENNHNYFANNILVSNCKFDWEFWKYKWGVEANIVWDTQLTHALAFAGLRIAIGGNDLKNLAKRYLGVTLNKAVRKEFLSGQWRTNEAVAYAAEDTLATFRLVPATRRLLAQAGQEEIWQQYELPLIPVIADMELGGIRVDRNQINTVRKEYEQQNQEVLAHLRTLAPGVNVNSRKQLLAFCEQEGIEIPEVRDKKTGKMRQSFDKAALATMEHPLARGIENLRKVEKMLSTYLLPWSLSTSEGGKWNPLTQHIHSSFTQVDTDTGRMAGRAPNLMQVPKSQRFRSIFVAGPGEKMVGSDFSQFELRILAEVSQDPAMRRVFINRKNLLDSMKSACRQIGVSHYTDSLLNIPLPRGISDTAKTFGELHREVGLSDMHSQTAIQMFDLDPDLIDLDGEEFASYRSSSKCISFGIPYQLGAASLAKKIGKTLEETLDLLQLYYQRFPGVEQYIANSKERGRSPVVGLNYKMEVGINLSYTTSIGGRKRLYPLPDMAPILKLSNYERKFHPLNGLIASIERQAVNHKIQSSNADSIKLALINLSKSFKQKHPKARIVLAVHDEIVSVCPAEEAEAVAELQARIMIEAGERFLKVVPVEVSTKVDTVWRH